MRVGFNPKLNRIKTDAGFAVDAAFLAHLNIAASDAVASSDTGVHAGIILAEAASSLAVNLTNPKIPRALRIKGNVAGIAGDVKLEGTNFAGEAIDETIALNGNAAVEGAKAFKTITKVTLPARTHVPVLQVETATAAGTVTTAGNALVTVTSALFQEAVAVDVPVVVDDDASAIALAIRTALAANEDIAANFTVSGATDKVILTAKVPAANDATLNIAIDDGTGDGASEGVTAAASSANTTAGVAQDIVSIGWNDKLGLPYKLAHNTVLEAFHDNTLEGVAAAVTVSSTAVEDNTIDLNTALNGKTVDIYLIV